MALFGSYRDINLFRHFNKELINNIIDSQVLVFTLDVEKTTPNIYGESEKKYYNKPIVVNCLVAPEGMNSTIDDVGYTVNQSIQFKFLRDELIEKELYIDVGDLIYWNDYYWEIDGRLENQLYMQRNPQTNIGLNYVYGWDVSVIFTGHLIQRDRIGLEYIIKEN